MITILIPTMNRPEFLIRLLNYYADLNSPYPILIGDSSDDARFNKLNQVVKNLESKLDVGHYRYIGLREPEATYQLLHYVKTPYLAWVPDDDFIIPSGLESAKNFLEANSDYSVAIGKGIIFELDRSGPHGKILATGSYDLRSIDEPAPEARLISHLSKGSNPNFGVHRTNDFHEIYAEVCKLKDNAFTELLLVCMAVLDGKIKLLDDLYIMRQGHDRRYLLPDAFDWITTCNWLQSHGVFRDALVKQFVEKHNRKQEDAVALVKQAFWYYVRGRLCREYGWEYGQDKSLREKVCECSMFKWGKIIKKTLKPNEMDLKVLLNPKSRFHKAFKPVYDCVTDASKF